MIGYVARKVRAAVDRLIELDYLCGEIERGRFAYAHTKISQGTASEAYKKRYTRMISEYNSLKYWWMRAEKP